MLLSFALAILLVPQPAFAQASTETSDAAIVSSSTSTTTENISGTTAEATANTTVAASAAGAPAADATNVDSTDVADATVSATCSIVGVDASGSSEVWATDASYSVAAGSTALDVTRAALAATGLTADIVSDTAYGDYLSTITSSDGSLTLGYDATTGAYWQFLVNGEYSDVGASSYVVQMGDKITWYYGADAKDVSTTCSIVGADASGDDEVWASSASYSVAAGSTALDVTRAALAATGLTADIVSDTAYGDYLSTITSPDGLRTLGYDATTGKYWQLFINGVASDVGASGYALKEGDKVTWYYSASGSGAVSDDGSSPPVTVDPTASHTDLPAGWTGYNSGSGASTTTAAPTTSDTTQVSWSASLQDDGTQYVNISDPLIVNDAVYLVTMSGNYGSSSSDAAKLQVFSTVDGTSLTGHGITLAGSIDFACRPVYADGIIVVPLSDGRLQGISAENYTTLWVTDAISSGSYSTTTLTESGGLVFMGTAIFGSSSLSSSGVYQAVDLLTGDVAWRNVNTVAGYYYTGAAVCGDMLVYGGDDGILTAVSASDGQLLSALDLGAAIRSTIVANDEGTTLYVVTYDGYLHSIALSADGMLSETAKVQFADTSVSTPTLRDGMLYVGGSRADYTGVLAVIDASTLKVVDTVSLPASVQCAPLVLTGADGGTYAYFTCNTTPGGVYVYRVGDSAAQLIYTPDESEQNYCMKSLIVDSNGQLYYSNDSGTFFALRYAPATSDGTDGVSTVDGGDSTGDDGTDVSADSGRLTAARASTATGDETAAASSDVATASSSTGTGASVTSAIGASEDAASQAAFDSPVSTSSGFPLPWVGLGVGIAGLLGAGAYLAVSYLRRRSQ